MKRRPGRKLLIAAAGVAAVSYACQENRPVGNLAMPEPRPTTEDASIVPVVGNLVPPPPIEAGAPMVAQDAGSAVTPDASPSQRDGGMPIIHRPTGNLMPPPDPPLGNLMPPPKADAGKPKP